MGDAVTAGRAFWIGVGLLLCANVLLPLQDALSKNIVTILPVWEVLFVRSLTVFVLALALGRRPLVMRAIRTRLKRHMAIRSLVILAGWLAFYTALRTLPLAQLTTIYFASPLIVALAAGPVLGERVSLPQWGAIALGFAGVSLASGFADFALSGAVLLALLSTCCWATALLMLRSMSDEEGSLVQVLFANGVFLIAMAPLLLVWTPSLDSSLLTACVLIGLVGGVGQLALYEAARRLTASLLATLEYSAILSAFVLGYAMFNERPTLAVSVGAAMVLASGIAAVAIGRFPAREAPSPTSPTPSETKGVTMTNARHDQLVTYIAKTRFPFPRQTTWPADYVTLTNVPDRKRAISTPIGEHYPDIVITDGTGRIREIGEVEMTLDPTRIPYLLAGSQTADDDTSAKVRHFFLYVPAGLEEDARSLLDAHGISYAGVRGFTLNEDGTARIVPFVTPGDEYDHQITDPQAA